MQTQTTPAAPPVTSGILDPLRARKLQSLGILSGFTAGAWLGAAEAPTKLVTVGVSPMVISLVMVIGVFLARWSLPALILGTSSVRCPASFDGNVTSAASRVRSFALADDALSLNSKLLQS